MYFKVVSYPHTILEKKFYELHLENQVKSSDFPRNPQWRKVLSDISFLSKKLDTFVFHDIKGARVILEQFNRIHANALKLKKMPHGAKVFYNFLFDQKLRAFKRLIPSTTQNDTFLKEVSGKDFSLKLDELTDHIADFSEHVRLFCKNEESSLATDLPKYMKAIFDYFKIIHSSMVGNADQVCDSDKVLLKKSFEEFKSYIAKLLLGECSNSFKKMIEGINGFRFGELKTRVDRSGDDLDLPISWLWPNSNPAFIESKDVRESTPRRDSAIASASASSSKRSSPTIKSGEDEHKYTLKRPDNIRVSSVYKDEKAFKRAQELRERRMQYTWAMRRDHVYAPLSVKPLTQFDSPSKLDSVPVSRGVKLARTPVKADNSKKPKDPKQPIAGLPRVMTPPPKKQPLPIVSKVSKITQATDPAVEKGSLRGGKVVTTFQSKPSVVLNASPDSRKVAVGTKTVPKQLSVPPLVELLPAPITQTVKYLISPNSADHYEYKQVLNLSGKIVKWGVFKKAEGLQKEELVYGWDDYQAKLSKKGSSMEPFQSREFIRVLCPENFELACRYIYRISNGLDRYECRKEKIYDFDRNKSFDAKSLLKERSVSVKSTLSLEEKCKALNEKENKLLQKFCLDTESRKSLLNLEPAC